MIAEAFQQGVVDGQHLVQAQECNAASRGKAFTRCSVFGDGQFDVIQHYRPSAFVGGIFTDGPRKQVR
jgi:hypothetical protein